MRNLAAILLPIGLMTAGCSMSRCYWYNPQRTLEQARKDCRQCYRKASTEASQAAADAYLHRADPPDIPDYDYYTTAEHTYAWYDLNHPAVDDWSTWASVYRWNVFNGCMKHKGYQKTHDRRLAQTVRRSRRSPDNVAGR